MKIPLVAALCVACWLIIAGLPAVGYNSLNESAETALSLSVPASEGVPADIGQEVGENYSANLEKISQGSVDNETSAQDSVDSHYNCNGQLWIVDYWGHRYPCNGKCLFLNDIVRMIVIPCKSGLLKLYEENPDHNVAESRYIRVPANKRYNWYFIGDTEGLHTLWFTVKDRFGQISRSNNATFRVIIENCSPIANCSPSFH